MNPSWKHDGRLLNLGSRVLGNFLGVALLEGSGPERLTELLTFLHRALNSAATGAALGSPHPLDAPCAPGLGEVPIPRCWW